MNDPDPVRRARDLAPAICAADDEIERAKRITEPVLEELHAARLSAFGRRRGLLTSRK